MKANDEFGDIRQEIRTLSTLSGGDRKRTLLCQDLILKAGDRKTLKGKRMILLMDQGRVRNLNRFKPREWHEFIGGMIEWKEGGTIEAIDDSKLTVIYL